MGGRGSGGGRSGGGGSAASQITNKNLEKAQNYLEKAYKYQDDYENYAELAKYNKGLAKRFEKEGKIKKAESYARHAKNLETKTKKIKRKLNRNNTLAEKFGNLKQENIPMNYQFKGEQGTRKVFKSPQAAKERWFSMKEGLVSTALADQPTIVQLPKGGYSVIPHKLLKQNNLTEISPYRIKKID